MKPIVIKTSFKKMLADVYTPVGIYLRLRDRFRDTILLESTDYHAGENSYSIIGINAIAGIEIINKGSLEFKLPGHKPEKNSFATGNLSTLLWDFIQHFDTMPADKPVNIAQ